uniref:Uncharacterized protein n=1 Tax=Mycena chlorophos TaxID=658473 RepID=A0ABQ0LLX0_MYCCL|nr:predicted protein [Mycena chlorophos]
MLRLPDGGSLALPVYNPVRSFVQPTASTATTFIFHTKRAMSNSMPSQTSFLATEEPDDALCRHFSLAKTTLPSNTPLQPSYTMELIAPVLYLPTHLLAVKLPAPQSVTMLLPIDAHLYHSTFDNASILPQTGPDTPPPSPSLDSAKQAFVVTLPVVPVPAIPHPASLSLVLLFGLGLETDRNLLATQLLPSEAIAEFPNAAAMAGVVSHLRTPDFDRYWALNQGAWKNTLALAARDANLTELVPMTLKVVADARKLRIRRW